MAGARWTVNQWLAARNRPPVQHGDRSLAAELQSELRFLDAFGYGVSFFTEADSIDREESMLLFAHLLRSLLRAAGRFGNDTSNPG